MSFKLMAQALDIKTGSSTTKLVLLKLCDNANDSGECWPSQSLIAEQCEMTTRTVITSIKNLESRGLLSVLKKRKNANKYLITLSSEKSSLVKEIHPSSENASPLSSENASLPYIEPIIIEPIKEILDYLNSKTGKNFRTANGLKTRFKEGYSVEDVKKVIDIKFDEWSKDKDMCQYLTPDTLFSNKFDKYLNQDSKAAPKPFDPKKWKF